MISFSVKKVLQKSEPEKKPEKSSSPKKEISIKVSPDPAQVHRDAAIHEIKSGTRSDLLTHAWAEYNKVSQERKKLSKQIGSMVESGATRAELKEHYHRINTLLQEGAEHYDRIQHIEQYGTLPQPTMPDVDIILLKDKRKKLVDQRCKLAKKVEKGQATNHKRVMQWQLELDQANAEYLLVDERIKKLEGKA